MSRFFRLSMMVLVCISMPWVSPCAAGEQAQVQPSTDGKLEGTLLQAKVRRDVLTVKIKVVNVSSSTVEPEFGYQDVYFTDIDEQKKYFALKDENGRYIAGPQHDDWGGGAFKERIGAGEQQIVWVKFPAPPETSTAIDVFIPGMLPFEEVEITR